MSESVVLFRASSSARACMRASVRAERVRWRALACVESEGEQYVRVVGKRACVRVRKRRARRRPTFLTFGAPSTFFGVFRSLRLPAVQRGLGPRPHFAIRTARTAPAARLQSAYRRGGTVAEFIARPSAFARAHSVGCATFTAATWDQPRPRPAAAGPAARWRRRLKV